MLLSWKPWLLFLLRKSPTPQCMRRMSLSLIVFQVKKSPKRKNAVDGNFVREVSCGGLNQLHESLVCSGNRVIPGACLSPGMHSLGVGLEVVLRGTRRRDVVDVVSIVTPHPARSLLRLQCSGKCSTDSWIGRFVIPPSRQVFGSVDIASQHLLFWCA